MKKVAALCELRLNEMFLHAVRDYDFWIKMSKEVAYNSTREAGSGLPSAQEKLCQLQVSVDF